MYERGSPVDVIEERHLKKLRMAKFTVAICARTWRDNPSDESWDNLERSILHVGEVSSERLCRGVQR